MRTDRRPRAARLHRHRPNGRPDGRAPARAGHPVAVYDSRRSRCRSAGRRRRDGRRLAGRGCVECARSCSRACRRRRSCWRPYAGGRRARRQRGPNFRRPVDVRRARGDPIDECLRERNVQSLDAPVSGGIAGARAGTLAIMASGARATFDEVEPCSIGSDASSTWREARARPDAQARQQPDVAGRDRDHVRGARVRRQGGARPEVDARRDQCLERTQYGVGREVPETRADARLRFRVFGRPRVEGRAHVHRGSDETRRPDDRRPRGVRAAVAGQQTYGPDRTAPASRGSSKRARTAKFHRSEEAHHEPGALRARHGDSQGRARRRVRRQIARHRRRLQPADGRAVDRVLLGTRVEPARVSRDETGAC